jgi:hypothetical protein
MASAKHTSMPSPVGGLNDRESFVEQKPNESVLLENWFPYTSYVGIRKGSQDHVTGLPATIETLVEYAPESGNSKLFAAAGTAIYDVTNSGAVGAAVVSGMSNARWQETMITTPGGSFLIMVNGENAPRVYNGSTWSAMSINHADPTTLIHVCLFKNRLFFVEKNSAEIHYLPVQSIGGNSAAFPLGAVFKKGGYVNAIYTWTLDAGEGSDDHLVVISSKGEVAVYSGTDPSSATDWRLVGVFSLGVPLGRRCGIKYAGDLLINCVEGVMPLARSLQSVSVDAQVAITDKIQNSVSVAADAYSQNFGWQLCLFEDLNMVILNVPQGNGANYQYVQNTITGSWAKFTGWDATVWLHSLRGLYFATGTTVRQAWVGHLDNESNIAADVILSFQYFGDKAANKYFTMVKPYLFSNGNPSIKYGLCPDFQQLEPEGDFNYELPTGMIWGQMVWGQPSMIWGGDLRPITGGWHTVGAVANTAALRLKIQNNGADVRFMNVSYVFNHGNVLNY